MHHFVVRLRSICTTFLPHFEAIKTPCSVFASFSSTIALSAILCCTCVMKCFTFECSELTKGCNLDVWWHEKLENCWYDCTSGKIQREWSQKILSLMTVSTPDISSFVVYIEHFIIKKTFPSAFITFKVCWC